MLGGGQAEWPSRAVTGIGSEVWGGNRDPPHRTRKDPGKPCSSLPRNTLAQQPCGQIFLTVPRPPLAVRSFLGVFGYTLKWVPLPVEKKTKAARWRKGSWGRRQ